MKHLEPPLSSSNRCSRCIFPYLLQIEDKQTGWIKVCTEIAFDEHNCHLHLMMAEKSPMRVNKAAAQNNNTEYQKLLISLFNLQRQLRVYCEFVTAAHAFHITRSFLNIQILTTAAL